LIPSANGGSANPYTQARTSEFNVGQQTPGYESDHASVLESKPNTDPAMANYHPNGVLSQYQRSGVGMSAQDASRRFIGQNMPAASFNGASSAQQEQLQTLRGIGSPSTPDTA
jgi:hypothetical protein